MTANTKNCFGIFLCVVAQLRCSLGSNNEPYFFYVVTNRMSKVECPAQLTGITSLYFGPESNSTPCRCTLTLASEERSWADGQGFTLGGFSSWDGYLTGKPSLRRTFEYKDWDSESPIELQFITSHEEIRLQINEETLVFDRTLLMGSLGAHPGPFTMICSSSNRGLSSTKSPNNILPKSNSKHQKMNQSEDTFMNQSALSLHNANTVSIQITIALSIGCLCLGVLLGVLLTKLIRHINRRQKRKRGKAFNNNYLLAPCQNVNIAVKGSEVPNIYVESSNNNNKYNQLQRNEIKS